MRPKRGAALAVNRVNAPLVGGWSVVEADLEASVDPIDHAGLMRLVRRRISDRRGLKRLRPWRHVGVREDGRWQATARGCPPGGVMRPRLTNRSWQVLDRYWTERDTALGSLTRSADALVLVGRTRSTAQRVLAALTQVLQQLKRTRHPTQTTIVEMPHEGCECLGFHCKKVKARKSGRLVPLRWPSQQALTAVRSQMRGKTLRRSLRGSLAAIVATRNPCIRGWRHDCWVGHSTQQLPARDRSVRLRLLTGGMARMKRLVARDPNAWLRPSGMAYFSRPGRCGGRP